MEQNYRRTGQSKSSKQQSNETAGEYERAVAGNKEGIKLQEKRTENEQETRKKGKGKSLAQSTEGRELQERRAAHEQETQKEGNYRRTQKSRSRDETDLKENRAEEYQEIRRAGQNMSRKTEGMELQQNRAVQKHG